MEARSYSKYVVAGLVCAVLLASVTVYQATVINTLKKHQLLTKSDEISSENVRVRRGVDVTPESYSTANCVNLHCHAGGATYTRWGKTNCSRSDVELVYNGIVGGSHYNLVGGGANYMCLSSEPQLGNPVGATGYSHIYGVEYRGTMPFEGNPQGPASLASHDVPCAVCLSSTRASAVMIPGRGECYPGWTREYRGYLMSGHKNHKGRSSFLCIDEMPDANPAGYRSDDGGLLYKVEASCGSLPCPPYTSGREVTCVVCSK